MKTRRISLTLIGVTAAAALLLGACSSDSSTKEAIPTSTSTTVAPAGTAPAGTAPAASGTIVDIAASNPDFSTLVSAVKAAGLTETLSGPGPFTVFAPTNDAFAKIPAATLQSLLEPANKDALAKILTYHVVAGKVMAADVKPGPVTTVEGTDFTVEVDGSDVYLVDAAGGKAKVVTTDIVATNGVIHVIDTVLMPAGPTS